jgi:hypothetical protein
MGGLFIWRMAYFSIIHTKPIVMKFSTIVCMLVLSVGSNAQLTGLKNVPGDFTTLADAVLALNSTGVGAGGVVINVNEPQTTSTGYVLTATGTQANLIYFSGNGNTITRIGTAATTDAIFTLAGSDYTVIDNFRLIGDLATEWGVLLANERAISPYNGCFSNRISNNVIQLSRQNQNSVAVLSSHQLPGSSAPISLTGFAFTDTHSNNIILDNQISQVCTGIQLDCPEVSNAAEDGNYISGNKILNFGGSLNPASGIRTSNNGGLRILRNTINGGEGSSQVTAIDVLLSHNGADITYNDIQITSQGTTSDLVGINAMASPFSTLGISDNRIHDCHYTTATSGSFTAIRLMNVIETILPGFTASSNYVENNSLSGVGAMRLIDAGHTNNFSITSNLIKNNTKTGASGELSAIHVNEVTGIATISANEFAGNGFTAASGNTASVFGIFIEGNSLYSEFIELNKISDLFIAGAAGNSKVTGCQVPGKQGGLRKITGNFIKSLRIEGAGTVTGIRTTRFISNNADNVSSVISYNRINELSGMHALDTIIGIEILSDSSCRIYNNMIGGLKTPAGVSADAVTGIYIKNGSNVKAYYNTIYLQGSSIGTGFGSSAMRVSDTVGFEMINNIFINETVPTGGGRSVAYQRDGAGFNNYNQQSNYNLLYSGTPGPANMIFFDGLQGDQSLAAFKARVAPREQATRTGHVNFENPLGSGTGHYLHVLPDPASPASDGGIALTASVRDDYDGKDRSNTTPDIGADEFAANQPACATLSNISVSAVTTHTAMITFSSSSGVLAIHSTLWSGPACGIGQPLDFFDGGSANSVALLYLLPGTTYTFCIWNCSDNNNAGLPLSITFTTLSCSTIITQQPSSASYCPGQPATLTFQYTNQGPAIADWYHGAYNIDATSAPVPVHQIASFGPSDAGVYYAIVNGCESKRTNPFVLTLNNDPACTATAVSAIDPTIQNLTIFPIPASSNLTVKFSSLRAGSISFFLSDVLGRVVYRSKQKVVSGQNHLQVPVSALSSGVYFFHAYTPVGMLPVKILQKK